MNVRALVHHGLPGLVDVNLTPESWMSFVVSSVLGYSTL